jgi:hypothetical protein
MTGINHDLLERALPILIRGTKTLVECSCQLRKGRNFIAPIPGTCAPESVDEIETALQLIRDIESEIGPNEEPEVEWFADLIDRRWSLTRKAVAS